MRDDVDRLAELIEGFSRLTPTESRCLANELLEYVTLDCEDEEGSE